MLGECERIKEGYEKAMVEVQQNCQVSNEQYSAKVTALESQYTEKEEQMRLMKYKDKC